MNAVNSTAPRSELTIRGIIIGIVITIVFTAANVYFGFKAGLTFSTSIPAAVISMAILKAMRDATIQENNIVQTIASAAGTLSAIIFVLPGLVIVGYWTGFPFWISVAICATGGILGVMYTIPLRRALVTDSDLPYPEGVACAEVLKVGAGETQARRSRAESKPAARVSKPWYGARSSRRCSTCDRADEGVCQSSVTDYFRVGGDKGGATGFDFGLSFALFAIGHLVGLWVGVAMLVGALIGWAWAVPYFTHLHWAVGAAADVAQAGWSHYVRFIGAGTIGVAAIWTLAKLVKPLASGLAGAFRASRARKAGNLDALPRTEHDMPIGMVGLISLICMIPIGWLLWHFAVNNGLGGATATLVIGGVAFVVLMSFLVSAVCGYMAGLIGSSNSPLSGIGILVVVIAALLLVLGVKPFLPAGAEKALVGFALFITSIVFAVASIANNNLQDLKTGQLVDATPSLQQWALVIGVLAGAVVIPPVMELLQHTYGFLGAPGADPSQGAAGATGRPDLGAGQGRDHRRCAVGHDRAGRRDRRRDHPPRRSIGPGEKRSAPAAAGGRPRHLPADLDHADGGGRCAGRRLVRSARRARPEGRGDQATGRAAGVRTDRGREPAGRDLRRRGRFQRQAEPDRAGG